MNVDKDKPVLLIRVYLRSSAANSSRLNRERRHRDDIADQGTLPASAGR
jgi:predicted amidohydrolase YtcJ